MNSCAAAVAPAQETVDAAPLPPASGFQDLTAAEAAALVEQATTGMRWVSKWLVCGGKAKLYDEDPAPRVIAALAAANARFTDPEYDLSVLTTVQGRPASNGVVPDDQCDSRLRHKRDHHITDSIREEGADRIKSTDYKIHELAWNWGQSWDTAKLGGDHWKRICDTPSPLLFEAGGPTYHDVNQHLKDCWFLSKMGSMAYTMKHVLQTAFSPNHLTHHGCHSVRVCIDDRECYMLLDDYIPTSFEHQHSRPSHWAVHWPLLYEKTYAKLNGGLACLWNPRYRYIDTASYGNLIQVLGGLPRERCFGNLHKDHQELVNDLGECWSNDWVRMAGIDALDHQLSLLWSGSAAGKDLVFIRDQAHFQLKSHIWAWGPMSWLCGSAVRKDLVQSGKFTNSGCMGCISTPQVADPYHEEEGTEFFVGFESFGSMFDFLQCIGPVSQAFCTEPFRERQCKYARMLEQATQKAQSDPLPVMRMPAGTGSAAEEITIRNSKIELGWSRDRQGVQAAREALDKFYPLIEKNKFHQTKNSGGWFNTVAPNWDFPAPGYSACHTINKEINLNAGNSVVTKTCNFEPVSMISGDPAGGWDLGDHYVLTSVTINRVVDCWDGEEDVTTRPEGKGMASEWQREKPAVKAARVDAAAGSTEALLYPELTQTICEFSCPDRGGNLYNVKDTKHYWNEVRKIHYSVLAETCEFDPPVRARYVSLTILDAWDPDKHRTQEYRKNANFDSVMWKGVKYDASVAPPSTPGA